MFNPKIGQDSTLFDKHIFLTNSFGAERGCLGYAKRFVNKPWGWTPEFFSQQVCPWKMDLVANHWRSGLLSQKGSFFVTFQGRTVVLLWLVNVIPPANVPAQIHKIFVGRPYSKTFLDSWNFDFFKPSARPPKFGAIRKTPRRGVRGKKNESKSAGFVCLSGGQW